MPRGTRRVNSELASFAHDDLIFSSMCKQLFKKVTAIELEIRFSAWTLFEIRKKTSRSVKDWKFQVLENAT